jgi:hypothetical protein
MQSEFVEGVQRLADIQRRADRQRVLAEVGEQPSREKLEEYWQLKQRQADS